MASLYDTDLAAWAMNSAALVRQGVELDEEQREQIAEELESMSKNNRRERDSRMTALIMHLLKLEFQPEKRSRSWDITIRNQRLELKRLLKQSPSLTYGIEEDLLELYIDARGSAELETGLDIFPAQNPFTLDQILNG